MCMCVCMYLMYVLHMYGTAKVSSQLSTCQVLALDLSFTRASKLGSRKLLHS